MCKIIFAINYVREREFQTRRECCQCGSTFYLANSRECSVINRICVTRGDTLQDMCNKLGLRPGSQPKRHKLNVLNVNSHEGEEHSEIVTICNVNLSDVKVVCSIGNNSVRLLVDSGTNKNIIDENTWELMIASGLTPD